MNDNLSKPLAIKLLVLAGLANILIAVLHLAMLFIGASAYTYFGAPASFVQHPDTLATLVQMLILIAFFWQQLCMRSQVLD